MTDAITREEKLMEAIATGSPSNIKPITREEMFLAKAGGQDVETPEPITRREKLLQSIIDNGGGGSSGGEGESNPIDAFIEGTTTELTSTAQSVANDFGTHVRTFTKVDFPQAVTIGNSAFDSSQYLKSATFPKATSVGAAAFYSCTALETIYFPLLSTIGQSAFMKCSALTEVIFPEVETINSAGFKRCDKLKTAIFPKLIAFSGSEIFSSCNELNTLVLGGENVVELNTTQYFSDTPFASGGTGGTVYVPQALIESYKTATNWSALYEAGTCNFVAIEGSEFE